MQFHSFRWYFDFHTDRFQQVRNSSGQNGLRPWPNYLLLRYMEFSAESLKRKLKHSFKSTRLRMSYSSPNIVDITGSHSGSLDSGWYAVFRWLFGPSQCRAKFSIPHLI